MIAVEKAVEFAGRSSVDPIRDIARLGEGWVGEEALAIGLCAALTAPRFTDAVRIASNHGGDSDSTALIAGADMGRLAGTRRGSPWMGPTSRRAQPLLDVVGRMIRAHGH